MLLTTATVAGDFKFEVLLSICCLLGLCDGCFITLIGPIAFDLCGPSGACQAIGSLLTLFSLPATVGPPVAGIIHDKVSTGTAVVTNISICYVFRLTATSPPFLLLGCLP